MIQSFALPSFWKVYYQLPANIQKLADKQYDLFSKNPYHPSLGFLKKGDVWTVEIGLHYRAIGRKKENRVYWFWIGTHESYNKLLRQL